MVWPGASVLSAIKLREEEAVLSLPLLALQIHTDTHTQTHTQTHIYIIHTQTHIQITHTQTHRHIHITHTDTHTHVYRHTQTHTNHTQTDTNRHTESQSSLLQVHFLPLPGRTDFLTLMAPQF